MQTSIALAVVIATKDRHLALKYISLPSLQKSILKNFVIVVWDASTGDLSRQIVDKFRPELAIDYMTAPRLGLASQRNDAVKYVLWQYPSVRYFLFIDDDSKLSPDAIEGVVLTFEKYADVWGVNVPLHRAGYDYDYKHNTDAMGRFRHSKTYDRRTRHRRVTSYMLQEQPFYDPNDIPVGWLQGGGMGVRKEVFSELGLFYDENLELFGGYALGEDLFFSIELSHRYTKKLWNSIHGYFRHMEVPTGRVNGSNLAAANFYNYRLAFDVLNERRGFIEKYISLILFYRLKFGEIWGWLDKQITKTECFAGYWKAMKAYSRHKKRKKAQAKGEAVL